MGVNADTGTTNSRTFNRRSTVSLGGNWGELRLGRDYSPTFYNYSVFDAFGTNGLGNSGNVVPAPLQQSTFVRSDNSIGYLLPAGLGGLYGQVMVAAGEGGNALQGNGQQQSSTSTGQTCVTPAQTVVLNPGSVGINPPIVGPVTVKVPARSCSTAVNSNSGHYYGGRLGFAAGPFDVAGSYAESGVDSIDENAKSWSIGGSFNFGLAKLMGWYGETDLQSRKSKSYSVSTVVPLGLGEIHASYGSGKVDGLPANYSADQFALGYVYNLSKRTAVYSTAAWLKNHDAAQASIASNTGFPTSLTSQAAPPTPGGKSQGIEFGVRHFF
jgi:predicted porin